jgi:hypothetical protein
LKIDLVIIFHRVFENIKMTEEIEAHVLKKYEILQKLGNDQLLAISINFYYRKGSLWYSLEGNRQEDQRDSCYEEEFRCVLKCNRCSEDFQRSHFLVGTEWT